MAQWGTPTHPPMIHHSSQLRKADILAKTTPSPELQISACAIDTTIHASIISPRRSFVGAKHELKES